MLKKMASAELLNVLCWSI